MQALKAEDEALNIADTKDSYGNTRIVKAAAALQNQLHPQRPVGQGRARLLHALFLIAKNIRLASAQHRFDEYFVMDDGVAPASLCSTQNTRRG